MSDKKKVAVIGSGIIGKSWALLFAKAGHKVSIFDVSLSQLSMAASEIRKRLGYLIEIDSLNTQLSIDEIVSNISTEPNLHECVRGAVYIQECIPEDIKLKRILYTELENIVGAECVIASSTSTLMPSVLFEGLQSRQRFMAVHPCNPPDIVPLVEIVPDMNTGETFINTAKALLEFTGCVPIVLKKEAKGFITNRIQIAIVNECMHLVRDGIVDVEDVEKVMTEGLGPRYCLLGKFGTWCVDAEMDFTSVCEKYGDLFHDVQKTMKPQEKFGGAIATHVGKDMAKLIPTENLSDTAKWREMMLAKIMSVKRNNVTAYQKSYDKSVQK